MFRSRKAIIVGDPKQIEPAQWINVSGTETGNGNHYVPAQGEVVCRMVDEAFKRAKTPNLYIITPFTSVVRGIRSALGMYDWKIMRMMGIMLQRIFRIPFSSGNRYFWGKKG